jgi:hypothetical protein
MGRRAFFSGCGHLSPEGCKSMRAMPQAAGRLLKTLRSVDRWDAARMTGMAPLRRPRWAARDLDRQVQ